MHRFFLHLTLSFLMLCAPTSMALESINLLEVDLDSGVDIAKSVEYTFEESCLRLEPAKLLNCGIWRRNLGSSINFGFQQTPFAFRFVVENPTNRPLPIYLEVAYPLLDQIELWYFQEAGFELDKGSFRTLIGNQVLGDERVFEQRLIRIPEFMFPLDLPSGTTEVLLRVKTSSSMLLPVRLWHRDAYVEMLKIHSIGQGVLMGGVAILLCYNLFLFLSIRETSYLYFALAMLGYLGVESMLNGFAFAYLWPSQVAWNRMALVPISNLALIFLMMFSRSFLRPERVSTWIEKVFKALLVTCSLVILLTPVLAYQPLIRVTAILVVAIPLFCYLAGWLAWLKGQKSSLFFLVAFSTYVLFAAIYVMSKYGLIEASLFSENAIHLGAVLTALLLSFALANQVREERSGRARAQRTALISLEKYQALYDQSLTGLFCMDMTGKLISCNPAFIRLMKMGGGESGQAQNSSEIVLDVFNEDPRSSFIFVQAKDWQQILERLEQGEQISQFVALCYDAENREFWGEFSFRKVDVEGGVVCDGTVTDITARRQSELALQFLARHDSLTGLLNREELEKRIESAMKHIEDGYALFFIDLDRFKMVNDSCGHLAGDELLKKLALLFRRVLGGSASIARFGGDEFAVLVPTKQVSEIQHLAENLRMQTAAFRFDWRGQHFYVSLSIGVVVLSSDFEDALDVLNCADDACYKAKHGGRNQVFMYSKKQQLSETMGYTSMLSSINEALEQDGFRLFYQPIVDLSKDEPGQRYELLLRMRREGQTLPTTAFLPIAQRYNLMPMIDQWVIRTYFHWLKDNPDQAAQLVMANINIDAQSMAEPGTLSLIRGLLRETGVDASKICFEITESAALASMEQTIEFIQSLRCDGFHFALDDFGRGYATYAYLKKLPVDFVKIDGVFVVDIDAINQTIVRSITDVAHAMGIKVVAEYVESLSSLVPLRAMKIDYGQGYYFAKPIALELSLPH